MTACNVFVVVVVVVVTNVERMGRRMPHTFLINYNCQGAESKVQDTIPQLCRAPFEVWIFLAGGRW